MTVVDSSVTEASAENRFHHALAELMQEREQLLVAFCSLLSTDAESLDPYRAQLSQLSQLLTDYSALAHFEVIDPIVSSGKLREADDIKTIAAIQDSTDDILAFTDHYSGSAGEQHSMLEFTDALNSLGERLAERFEFEDQLFGRFQVI